VETSVHQGQFAGSMFPPSAWRDGLQLYRCQHVQQGPSNRLHHSSPSL